MKRPFSKYLKGTANPEEFALVLGALGAPESEVELSNELMELWNESLGQIADSGDGSCLLDRIHHRIALEESNSVARRITLYGNLLKVAAVLIVGLISSVVWLNQPIKVVEPTYSPIVETVSTPYGARTSFKLPDGSEVWLNSGSSLSFPRQYGAVRKVKLKGEAYFKVAKDGKRFIVETGQGQVEVMGTSFDVKAYPEENFETTLVEGVVKVCDKTRLLATLKPGERSVLSTANAFSLKAVNTDLITSWKDGKLIFVKEPFVNVVRELERWYNVKIEIQGNRLKNLGYTGTIEMETFGEILELLNTTTPIKYQYNKNTRVLKIAGR